MRVRDAPPRRGVGHSLDTACESATRRRGLTHGSGSAPGRTRAVSACATRATRALPEPGSVPSPSSHTSARSAAPPAIEAGRGASAGRGGGVRGGRARPTRARKARPQGHARAQPAAQVPWAAPQPMAVVRALLDRRATGTTPTWCQGSTFLIATGASASRVAHGRSDGTTGTTGDRKLRAEARCWYLGIKKRALKPPLVPSAPGARPSTRPMAQRRDPIPPSTPGARVLDRDPTVLAGYHPSGRPVGAAYDRDRIRTKAASTSPERVSGLRLPRRAARDGTRPTGTEYCCRRFGGGLQNAEIAFQSPWYKFETPCPLVRPSQTHLWRSARAPVDRGPWGLGVGV